MQSPFSKFPSSYSFRISLIILSVFCNLSFSNAQEQWKWFNPVKADFKVIQNQGWSDEIGNTYTRFPERAKESLRPVVWNLSQNSAGLGVYFYSNASEIMIRYHVKDRFNMPHMQSTGVSGIDLYSINSDGIWNFNFGKYSFEDTISYYYQNIPQDKYHKFGYEYRLFLPLYNRVEWMEIGVPDSASFEFIPLLQDKPIVLYGTSIAQGACASRPGMAWTNILQRAMDHPLINLGFSGNGQLEDPVLDLMNEIDARIYILDCFPNLSQKSEDEISQLTINAVKRLRAKNTTPILIIGHSGYSNSETNTSYKSYLEKNDRISMEIYKTLISQGIKDLYFLPRKELNLSPEAWVDYVHFSDLGMTQQATAVEKKLREILKEPKGNIITTIPVSQRREPGNYEWKKRHNAVLDLNRENPPKAVILGNSIIHFWGGKPEFRRQTGADSWNKTMEPAGYHNLGFGWDRIENVLWRVYHGEIDSPGIQKVTMMIGTNNIGVDHTDNEIIEGLNFLIAAIKVKQPKATVKIVGILPRKDKEQRISSLNQRIKTIAVAKGCVFINPGTKLLNKSGKIDETLFSDGLHPNAKGYSIIAKEIAD